MKSIDVPGIYFGVQLLTEPEEYDELPKNSDLPVLGTMRTHGQVEFDTETENALWAEYFRVYPAFSKDFSCGKAVTLIRSGATSYEPADCEKRLSDHLVTFLAEYRAKLAAPPAITDEQ